KQAEYYGINDPGMVKGDQNSDCNHDDCTAPLESACEPGTMHKLPCPITDGDRNGRHRDGQRQRVSAENKRAPIPGGSADKNEQRIENGSAHASEATDGKAKAGTK